jgi:signal transduction histidine kinase
MEAERQEDKEHFIDLQLLITALDTVSDGLIIVDQNYKILYTNVAANYLMGGIKDFFDLETWRSHFKIYSIKKKKELTDVEMPIFRAINGLKFTDYRVFVTTGHDGHGYYISCNGTPLIGKNNKIVGGVVTFRDITSNYLSERILSQERAFFKNILDLIPALVFVRGEVNDYYFTNQAFDDFRKEYAKQGGDNDLTKMSNIDEIKKHDQETFRNLKAMEFAEDLIWPDGSIRNYKTIRFPIYSQTHDKILICGVLFDITESIRSEKNLQMERLKLINASKLAAIGSLAGEIGHEINNPIAVIKSITFMLREMIEDHLLTEEILKTKLTTIDTTLERTTKIISSLKNLSRKSQTEKKEPCTLKNILHDVIDLSELKFREKDIRLDINLSDSILDHSIDCFEVQIGEVLMNLLSNAIDAVEGQEDRWVKIEIIEGAEDLIINFQDSGPGIPENLKEKIFEPYFTTKSYGKGTGLGLSISRNIMRGHGGDLYLTGRSTFVMKFPK